MFFPFQKLSHQRLGEVFGKTTKRKHPGENREIPVDSVLYERKKVPSFSKKGNFHLSFRRKSRNT
jgi:hypothetical protein